MWKCHPYFSNHIHFHYGAKCLDSSTTEFGRLSWKHVLSFTLTISIRFPIRETWSKKTKRPIRAVWIKDSLSTTDFATSVRVCVCCVCFVCCVHVCCLCVVCVVWCVLCGFVLCVFCVLCVLCVVCVCVVFVLCVLCMCAIALNFADLNTASICSGLGPVVSW
jgi:hypothetical protein